MPVTSKDKSHSSRRAHLETVLADFDGDIEAATEALRELRPNSEAPSRPAIDPNAPITVEVEHASRQYKVGSGTVHALQDASLTIHQGEIVAITGPSGSGKSTLLNLIGALDQPDSGRVVINGQDLTQLHDRQLAQFRNTTIGFVFQFFYLQPFLNVRTNLAVPGMFARLDAAERDNRIAELAEAVGLTDRLDHLPKALSGGQMQRAAIARALFNRPKLILADEPTGNVDRANAHSILELFEKIRQSYQTTVIIVTHDTEMAQAADRSFTLRDGKIIT